MASEMHGPTAYRKALRKAPDDLKSHVAEALRETVVGVHTRGKANIRTMLKQGPHRTGVLERNYRRSVSSKSLTGRVGYLSARAREVAFYARFVHDGTRHSQPHPFHGNAVEAELEHDKRRMIEARDTVLRKLAEGGDAPSALARQGRSFG